MAEDDGMADPTAAESALSETHKTRKGHEVWLHVYDIDPVTARLNQAVLKSINLGAFHCGVEVLGDEWFFAWGESDATGIIWNEPRLHQVHIYRESVCMGETPLSNDEIRDVVATAMDNWPANSYHPIHRNCITFAEELVQSLRVAEPFPAWVRGAVDAGKSPLLAPVADWGWQWIKWWCSTTPEAETRHAP
mmetsp:Transcript_34327/g.106576  ORF Transcript_34327/g.106576 Transcript_34327/m.106576 type:complete len:192 (-) Transcript_34327:59-634(-)|eukprot:CAMPEP_0204608958 /NCGR_PEP_ID=MMETSP0661-20131031/60636_1 /ASSEMBLY_ACC=CAM_ASM_000606 /TAXON_ID=109239 /ORGANISM="Alexandrium margalefi, Strain AMGDE01CS-322" /LENGTH=191 /DNA_ID=CAMNT_0051620569 /DNA_START=174 /DNA_END=749 /DNA_ORIENTATION=+